MPGFTKTRREFLKASAAAAVLAGGGAFPALAASDPARIALVVGNNAYPFAPLGNAINDAKAVSDLLVRAGFNVTLRTDVTGDVFRQSANVFAENARKSEAKFVFFYYAGHGTQMDWHNYFVPVDANVTSASDLPQQCFDLSLLLNDLSRTKDKVFVIILDACRDNPFGATYRTSQKGLSQFDAPVGSLLAFSTAPGSVASDGIGANSLYTENLVRELSTKGARLEDSLKRVRLSVRLASRGAQVPWESTSLETDVFLFPTGEKLSEAQLEEQFQRELDTWNRIKGSKEPDDWVAYLRDYPSGRFTEIAQTRLSFLLTRLEEAAAAAAAPPVVAVAVKEPEAMAGALAAAVEVSHGAGTAAPLPEPSSAAIVETRFDLEIRAGLPVPVLMHPLENPLSGGTYVLNRRYSVGDEALFDNWDLVYGQKQKPLQFRVTRVDEDADRVELNDGLFVLDCMGNLIKWLGGQTFDPRRQVVPAELQLGKRWATRYHDTKGGAQWDVVLNYKVVRREKISVPAGEFDAFRLEGDGWNVSQAPLSSEPLWSAQRGRLTVRHWVVPGFNFALKTEFLTSVLAGSDSGVRRELVSCRQRRWSVA